MNPTSSTSEARSRLLGLDASVRSRLEAGPRTEPSSVPERQLTRLLEIAKAMNRIHDQDQLLEYVSERLRELFDAQNSFVILFGEDGEPVIQASHLEDPHQEPHRHGGVLVSHTLLERVRSSREPIIIDDAAQHSELRNRDSIEELRIASALCAPLIVEDEVIGILQFDQRGDPRPFPPSDLRLLSLFADQVATALHSLGLIQRIQAALAETREAQSRLVAAERLSALGEMAGGIAHNFNNALFVALGLCDVILAKGDLPEDVRSSVDRIRTCSLDAASTVRRLKSFAGGRAPEDRDRYVHPSAVAEELPELTRHKWRDEAAARGVRIEVELDSRPTPAVAASAAELREVMTNLIFNAVDAMDADGKLRIAVGVEAERVFLRVQDDGTGMEESVKRHVFEPFFTTKGANGTGFGLSTCWSIVQALGGEIVVESAPGRGSTFTVWLPSARDVVPAAPRVAASTSGGASILVVDDDPAVRGTILEMIRTLGHRATASGSGPEALAVLPTGRFDLVLSDVGMPDMNGYELARELLETRPGLPIVLLTGWGSDVKLDAEVAARVVRVLAKPVTLDALEEVFAEALQGRRVQES